jgi:hypothetical protein
VATKKRERTNAARPEALFLVVLEDLRSKLNVFGEALQGFREDVDRRFEQVDRKFDQVDRRFGQLELAVLENSRAIQGLRGELADVRGTVTRIEAAVATKVDRRDVEAIVERALARRQRGAPLLLIPKRIDRRAPRHRRSRRKRRRRALRGSSSATLCLPRACALHGRGRRS